MEAVVGTATSVKNGAKKTSSFGVGDHTLGKPSAIVDLFDKVTSYAMALGPDVTQRVAKYYVGYYAGKKSFFTMKPQTAKISVYLSLPANEAQPWTAAEMRDVSNIGKHGLGETEFDLRSPDQLGRLETLLKSSYLRNRK